MIEPAPRIFEFAGFRLDCANKRLMRGDTDIALTPKVFDTLLLLVENAPQLVEKEEFLRRLWPKTIVEESALAENVSRLRRALGESETQRFIETRPKRGYRFVAEVVRIDEPVPSAAATESRPRRRASGIAIAIAALASLAALTAAWLLLRPDDRPAAVRSIAVLPFASLSADPEQAYFSDGMTDELITRLAKLRSLRVISRSSVMRYKGTHKSIQEIARELNVDAIVEGTVSRSPERVRVSVQVIRASSEEHLWAENYDRAPGDLVALEEQLAREIADGIRLELGPGERAALGARREINAEAHEAFLRGRYFWARRNEASTRRALAYFQAAIDADPAYAPAYAGLADAYVTLALPEALQEVLPPSEAYPQARSAGRRAMELDPTSGEALATLAHIRFQYDHDWAGAEADFRRAIELSPNYANAHQWLALALFWHGRHEEARREVQKAHELDPLSLVVNANECFILGAGPDFDAANVQCHRAIELDPDFVLTHHRFGEVLIVQGRYQEAVAELRRAVELSGECPRAVAELALALALSGDRTQAAQLLTGLREMAKRRHVGAFDFAIVHAALGEHDRALDELERAFSERSPSLALIEWSPAFAQLRTNPRFVALVRRVGLPD